MKLEEFEGCDGGDPGSPEHPSIWLMGIEHGTFKSIHDPVHGGPDRHDPDYGVETQLGWPYNRNAFKLLTAIDGRTVDGYREFARERNIFARGARGYFKGNLYPYASRRASEWSADASRETGMDKKAYRAHCELAWFPVIRSWIEKHRPRLVIGAGSSFKNQFARAILGGPASFESESFAVNGKTKHIHFAQGDATMLVVVPHLSGSANGLNSDAALQEAGARIAQKFAPRAKA